MFCPECGVSLRAVEHAGVTARVCARCAGMWLGRADLASLVEREAGELAVAFGEGDRERARERDDFSPEMGAGVGVSHGAPHPLGYPGEPPRHGAAAQHGAAAAAHHHAHGVLDALRRLAEAECAAGAGASAESAKPASPGTGA